MMPTNTNKKDGNRFETDLCKTLFDHGFWAHNMAQNKDGQPADIIAAKHGNPFLIDCKVCSGRGFNINRIEENQELSMKLWSECGNGSGWFAIRIEGEIYMVSYPVITAYAHTKRLCMLSKAVIHDLGIPLERWLEICV